MAAIAAINIHLPQPQGLHDCPFSVLHALLSQGLFVQGSVLQLLFLSVQPQAEDSGLGASLAVPGQQAGAGDCLQSALGWGLAPESATLGQQAGTVDGQQEALSD